MIPITRPLLPPLEDYVELLEEIWSTRMLSNFGRFAQEFESHAETYLGVPFALGVASCDLGLILTLKAFDLPRDSPCYVSDFTFNSTINAAIWAGLKPVLVDVDEETYNMSPDALRTEMGKTNQGGIVLATHVFGNPCDVEALSAVAADHNSLIVFDAAHAYGSSHAGVRVGNFGDAEVFSFSGTKLVTSAEGGIVATRHEWLAERIRFMRAYGFQHDYRSKYVGLNAKMSELNGALGVLSIREIDTLLKRRMDIVHRYQSELGDAVQWQRVSVDDVSTYKDLCLGFGSAKSDVQESLARVDVQTKRYFVPLHTMDPYRGFNQGAKPVADSIHEKTLCVPLYPDMEPEDVDLIVSTILSTIG